MVVRRNESRRRRVGVNGDPVNSGAESAVPSTPPRRTSSRDSRAYSFGADRRNQLKTTDLVPKRWTSFSLVVLLLLASIGLLNLLSNYAGSRETQIGVSEVSAFGLAGRGTIASWFSSFLLIITGLASLQIYALRQHRRDDYRGTYRLWIWMAALLMFASLNCVVDLAGIATNLISSWTLFSFQGKSWLPVTVKLVVLSTLIARGLYEVRASRGSFALVLFVWVAYSTAAVIQLPAVRPAMVNLGQEATLGNCLLFGTAALLMAELVYARFIYLHAHGLIKQRVANLKVTKPKAAKPKVTKPKRDKQAKAAKARQSSPTEVGGKRGNAAKTAAEKSTKGTNSPSKGRNAAAKSTQGKSRMSELIKARKSNRDQEAHEQEDESVIKLSKSELRRQRKEAKRRRAA